MRVPSKRTRTERWERVGWNVRQDRLQALDGDGVTPSVHEDGTPVLVNLTTIVFQLYGQDGSPELTVEIPLDDDTRRALAAKLNGGVVVAGPHVNGFPRGV